MKRRQFEVSVGQVEAFFKKARKMDFELDLIEVTDEDKLAVDVLYDADEKYNLRMLEDWFDELEEDQN